MPAIALDEFITELEGVVRSSSAGRHIEMLRQVTGLLVSCAGNLNEHQVGVFDDVLLRLMQPVDARALARLSAALSDIMPPPREVVRRLAFHEDAAVAAPLLLKSRALSQRDLIEIAGRHSQQHLRAIAGRSDLREEVTDALLKRADTSVRRDLAKNATARFSSHGYSIFATAAARDDEVADALVVRADIPEAALHDVLCRTSRTARARLAKLVPAEKRDSTAKAIERIESEGGGSKPATVVDYSEARAGVHALNVEGRLNDSSVNRFAVRGEHANLVAALALLAAAPIETIEPLLGQADGYGLMVACRASRLNWNTTSAVIKNRLAAQSLSARSMAELEQAFETLNLSAAQRLIRYEPAALAKTEPAADLAVAGAG